MKIERIKSGVYKISQNRGTKIVDCNFVGWGGDLRGNEFREVKRLLDSEDLEVKETPFNVNNIVDNKSAIEWWKVIHRMNLSWPDTELALSSFILKISENTNKGKNGGQK